MSAWAQIYPNATAVILHKRNGDQAKELTGATYDSATHVLSWTTSSYDTFYDGFGVAEVRMVESDVVKKTKDAITTVTASSITNGSGNITESNYQAFLNAVIGNKTDAQAAQTAAEAAQEAAEDAAAAAEAAVENGPYIDETTGNWFVYDWDDEEYKNTGVHAKGDKGDPGTPGTNAIDDTTTASDKVWSSNKTNTEISAKYTKPGTGIPAADIASGVIPVLTDLIDDTAGEGDTDVTFSADKLTSDFSDVLNAINDKISEPQSEGTSGQVLTTDGNGGRTWETVQGGGSSTIEVKDSTKTGVDFDISDESGNVIGRFSDGNFATKNFDSINFGKDSTAQGVDLDVSDTNGNVLIRLKDGEIHTKYFHSKPTIITLKSDGTGDFSTLKGALGSISNSNPETNPYEIHVYPGTYDTLAGYTDAEIRAADIGGGYTDSSMVGCKLQDGVSLIGIGNRESIILTAYLSTSEYGNGVRGNISTLNLK